MNISSQNNITWAFVGKDVAITTGAISALNDGEIGIFTPGGTRYTEAAADANDKFIVAVGRTDDQVRSEVIYKNLVEKVVVSAYVADAEQLDYIGYNGTTGSIVTNNDTTYRVSLNMMNHTQSNHGPVYVKDLTYVSDSTAAQSEIALGLAKSGISNFDREADSATAGVKPVSFKALTSAATSAGTDFDGTMTVVRGSNTITVTSSGTYNTGTALAAGDFIRMGATATTAVALTDDVYKVISITGTTTKTVVLDRKVQVPSGAYVTGSNYNQVITAATGASSNWGVACSGNALKFSLGKLGYRKVRWELNVDSDSFGTTPITNSTAATEGNGNYEQVAQAEWFASGNQGEFFRMGEPNIFTPNRNALSTENYDCITIYYKTAASGVVSLTEQPKVLHLFIDNGRDTGTHYALAGATDDITDVLEDLLDGVTIYGGAVTADGGALADGDLALT